MIYKKLKEIMCVDTISQNKSWKTLNDGIEELMKENPGEEITIDFTGINIERAMDHEEFKKLIRNKALSFEFVNQEELVSTIKMFSLLENGVDMSKIHNTHIEKPKAETKEEKKVASFGKQMLESMYIDDKTGYGMLNVDKIVTSMFNPLSCKYVEYATTRFAAEHHNVEIVIDISNVEINDTCLDKLAQLVVESSKQDIVLHVNIKDSDSETSIGKNYRLYLHKYYDTDYTEDDKQQLFSQLAPGTVGIFTKYKTSKAVDDFGRLGKGEIVSAKIAVFRGLRSDCKSVAMFDTYSKVNFTTKTELYTEEDDEDDDVDMNNLKYVSVEAAISDIGYDKFFLGPKYHFSLPVAYDEQDTKTVIIGLDSDEHNIKKRLRLPERIKVVFDDWGVEYNKENLDKAIAKTNEILGRLEQ